MTTSAASARLVATLTAPLDRDRDAAYAPSVLRWPDRRLLIQRGDFEAVAVDLDDPSAPQTRFPAPWPRRFGTFTVAPGGDLAVFAGVHSVRAVALRKAAVDAVSAGVSGIMLFGVPADEKKDARGTAGTDPDGILQVGLRAVREEVGDDLVVMSDLCLDEYTDHGHCGVLTADGRVDNDATLERYAEMAQVQADAGAHVVGPSGMMDGQVGVIRD
ncbi:hypothetical protein ACWDXT_35350, partial [Streptomyces sp. NPDC003236]